MSFAACETPAFESRVGRRVCYRVPGQTIPANYSNGYLNKSDPKYPHVKPFSVPGCPECAFSDDGFYYTPNHNITRDVARVNNCSFTGGVRHYPTPTVDGTEIATQVNWTCFTSFGACAVRGRATDVVRCSWTGTHALPARTHLPSVNATPRERHLFFPRVMWAFVGQFYLPVAVDAALGR